MHIHRLKHKTQNIENTNISSLYQINIFKLHCSAQFCVSLAYAFLVNIKNNILFMRFKVKLFSLNVIRLKLIKQEMLNIAHSIVFSVKSNFTNHKQFETSLARGLNFSQLNVNSFFSEKKKKMALSLLLVNCLDILQQFFYQEKMQNINCK